MNDQACYETGYARHASGAINSRSDILLTSSLVIAFLIAAVTVVIVMAPISPLAMTPLSEPGSMPNFVRVQAPAPPPAAAAAPEIVGETGSGFAQVFQAPQPVVAGVQSQPVFAEDRDEDDNRDRNRGKGKGSSSLTAKSDGNEGSDSSKGSGN